jgi:hypothetical protein
VRLCPAILGLCTLPPYPCRYSFILQRAALSSIKLRGPLLLFQSLKIITFSAIRFAGSISVACSQYYYHILCHWICWVKISGVQSILLSQSVPLDLLGQYQRRAVNIINTLDLLGQDQWRTVNITITFCVIRFAGSRSAACSQYYYHILCHSICWVKISGVQSILLSYSVPLDLLGQGQRRAVNIIIIFCTIRFAGSRSVACSQFY